MSDLIKREDVFAILRRNYSRGYRDIDGDFVHGSIDEDAFDEVKALPSEEPKRKKGHWEIYVISPFDGEDCRCSECGQCDCLPYWNFCPNCGADMRGGV